jgi:DNA (cytosine-5)-methyltransferase 1
MKVAAIDLFCGAGGLTHGFFLEGLKVKAGLDLDPACRYPYEANNNAIFLERDISSVSAKELNDLFGDADIKVLAGCAPCQPFSSYAHKYALKRDQKWKLLYEFSRLIKDIKPQVVTMENVPTVYRYKVFHDFVKMLEKLGYHVWYGIRNSADYGVPQSRRRMVLLASKLGPIDMIEPTHDKPKTVRQVIGRLKVIKSGEACDRDRLHAAAKLSDLNLKRIKVSIPGGSWRDWPKKLVASCHKEKTGKTFPSVYGRMVWDQPAPTMTTQCYGFGNGRFGHPIQNRAISLREAAILQDFPRSYKFLERGERVNFRKHGRMIGNAVPVGLGRAIAKSIKIHLSKPNKKKAKKRA